MRVSPNLTSEHARTNNSTEKTKTNRKDALYTAVFMPTGVRLMDSSHIQPPTVTMGPTMVPYNAILRHGTGVYWPERRPSSQRSAKAAGNATIHLHTHTRHTTHAQSVCAVACHCVRTHHTWIQ